MNKIWIALILFSPPAHGAEEALHVRLERTFDNKRLLALAQEPVQAVVPAAKPPCPEEQSPCPDPPPPNPPQEAAAQERQEPITRIEVVTIEDNPKKDPWHIRFIKAFDNALPGALAAAVGGLFGWFLIEIGRTLLTGAPATPWGVIVAALLVGIALGGLLYYLLRNKKDKQNNKEK